MEETMFVVGVDRENRKSDSLLLTEPLMPRVMFFHKLFIVLQHSKVLTHSCIKWQDAEDFLCLFIVIPINPFPISHNRMLM